MDDLNKRIQNLPRELFDHIKNYVFTFDGPYRIVVTDNLRPPSPLHVSRATRKQFAKSFFASGTIFMFKQPATFKRWMKNLDKKHLAMIKNIELHIRKPPCSKACDPLHVENPTGLKDCLMYGQHILLWNLHLNVRIEEGVVRSDLFDSPEAATSWSWWDGQMMLNAAAGFWYLVMIRNDGRSLGAQQIRWV